MKPLFLRGAFALLSLFLGSFPAAHAEWISLQIPLARASHQFTFWERGSSDSVPLVLAAPADQMGYGLGDYSRSPAGPPLLEGGTFDGSGVWHPDGSAYATISALRQGAGTFFLRDQDTMELSLPGQTDLLYSQWQTINAAVPVQFVAIGENRHDHLLAFVYGNLFIPLTNGAVNVDQQNVSLGYFDAWATGIDPAHFSATGTANGKIVDLTAGESAPSGPNLAGQTWSPDTQDYSLQPLTLVFASAEQWRQFDIYTPLGSIDRVRAVWNAGNQRMEGDHATMIGSGINFRVVGVSPGGAPVVATSFHQMPLTPMTFAPGDEIPPTNDANLRTLTFKVDPARNPAGMSVHSNKGNYDVPLTVPATQSSALFAAEPGVNVVRNFYLCTAAIDVDDATGWFLKSASGANLGSGTEFMIWPNTPPPAVTQIVLPAQRRGNAIVTSQGREVTRSSAGTPVLQTDFFLPATNYATTWDSYNIRIENSGTSTLTLTDSATGETSTSWSLNSNGSIYGMWQNWFPSSSLLLRISGTRWQNNLEVRCGNGQIIPLTKHRIQGDWSTEPLTGANWFNPYGFFDASSNCSMGIPWHLYDRTRGQYLTAASGDETNFLAATDDTDSDGDGLPDWYEIQIGTKPNNANSDGDTQEDGYEVLHGTNPLARPVAASGATLKVFTALE